MSILTFKKSGDIRLCDPEALASGCQRVYISERGEESAADSCTYCDERVYHIRVSSITTNPMQPRRVFEEDSITALADSISKYGILQPLTVRVSDGYPFDEGYELVAGERRLRAAKLLGLSTVPCLIISVNERQSAELSIIENLQREGLNIFEEASAISALICIYSLTQEQVASRLCVSQSYVANKLRLLRLSEEERRTILEHSLTERHARALLKISDPELRRQALDKIIERHLNVSQSEEYIERLLLPKEEQKKRTVHGAIKDVKLFYNSIDNAMKMMRRSGVDVVSKRRELEDEIEVTIRIKKPKIEIPTEE